MGIPPTTGYTGKTRATVIRNFASAPPGIRPTRYIPWSRRNIAADTATDVANTSPGSATAGTTDIVTPTAAATAALHPTILSESMQTRRMREPATDVAPVTAESAETTERRTMPTDPITNQWMSDTSRLRISHNEACIATSIGIMIHETATGFMT